VGANEEQLDRERQAALNQALRREVNERRTEAGEDADVVQFVCECSDPACEELVSLTIDEYEFIRNVPIRLVVRPGHMHHETERVLVEEPGRFLIIEKFGPAGDVIAHLDPRGPMRERSAGKRSPGPA
jgi:hypothetical protein